MACEAHEREKQERLCRYITRPAVSTERLPSTARGGIRAQRRHRPGARTDACHRSGRTADGTAYALDDAISATGFDGMGSALPAIDLRGRGELPLRDSVLAPSFLVLEGPA